MHNLCARHHSVGLAHLLTSNPHKFFSLLFFFFSIGFSSSNWIKESELFKTWTFSRWSSFLSDMSFPIPCAVLLTLKSFLHLINILGPWWQCGRLQRELIFWITGIALILFQLFTLVSLINMKNKLSAWSRLLCVAGSSMEWIRIQMLNLTST